MRTLSIITSFTILWLMCGCAKDETITDDSDLKFQKIVSDSGRGTVVGWQGYFSPSLSPFGYQDVWPGGYRMSNFTWERGESPDSTFGAIYLFGRETDLSKAHRVRVTGNWVTETRTLGTQTARLVNLTIDSLEVLE